MSARRWLEWEPKTRIFTNPPEREPTKPSIPGSVGFEGAISGESSKIAADIAHASALLNRRGVRTMRLGDSVTIGVWSDLDGPEIRATLRVLEMHERPVLYLDGPGVPIRFKVRRVAGESGPWPGG